MSGETGRVTRSRWPRWRAVLLEHSSLLLFAFVVAVLAVRVRYNVYDDLMFWYPFVGWDGYEWITERLHYLDPTIRILHRNPGLPLVLAALEQMGGLRLYPAVQSLTFVAFLATLHAVVRRFVSTPLASFAVLTTFLCFKLHSAFDYVLADGWALLFMTASIHFLFAAPTRPRRLVLAAGMAGLSFVFQFSVAFIAPAYAYFVLMGPVSPLLRSRWRVCLVAAIAFAVIALPQFVYTFALFGTFIPPTKNPLPIVGFHLFGLFYYLVNTLAWVGLPSAGVIVTGIASSARSEQAEVRFIHLATASTFVFWVLLYRWLDQRFLLYFVPFFTVYFALGVERIVRAIGRSGREKRRAATAAAAAIWLVGASVTAAPLGLYSYAYLPIAPGWLVRFHEREVGDFGANVNITLDPAPEHTSFPEWSQGFRAYYRQRWKDREYLGSIPLRDELLAAGARVSAAVPRGTSIAVCTDGPMDHTLHHMMLHSLRRNLVYSCDPGERFVLAETEGPRPPVDARVLHSGDLFVLYARAPGR